MSGLSVAIDSNLLLLLVVGMTSRDYVEKHKRLKAFTSDDYDLLQNQLRVATEIVVTPNTLTETSNFIDHMADPARSRIYDTLRQLLRLPETKEICVSSASAVEQSELPRLGLTDCVLLDVCSTGILLVTVDIHLYLAALNRGEKVLNFNYLRDM